jgi:hypothetical protein
MTMIVVLFNLKDGVKREDYENWARSTDLPLVNKLPSVSSFDVLKTTGLLGTDAKAPFEYVELLNVSSMVQLGADVSTDTMQKVAAEFQAFADNPAFMLTENV